LAIWLATSGCGNLFLECDALLVVLTINNPSLFFSWSFATYISDISLARFIFLSTLEFFESVS